MRWTGPFWVALFMAAACGCELLVPFESVPEGAGASGGSSAGSSGAAGSSGSAGSGGSSMTGGAGGTGTATITCTMECDDHDVCTSDSCDLTTGQCVYAPDRAGLLVSNDDPNDCVKTVCDDKGGTTIAPDDSEVPMTDGSECHDLVCLNGAPVPQPKNEGGMCGSPLTDVCQKSRMCVAGKCFTDVYADGDYASGCETLTCVGGMSSNIQLHDDKCGQDIPNNCTKPTCLDGGSCIVGPAVAGASCYDGQQGQCNGTDTTCHH